MDELTNEQIAEEVTDALNRRIGGAIRRAAYLVAAAVLLGALLVCGTIVAVVHVLVRLG